MNRLIELPKIAAKYHTARTLNPENPNGTHDYMPVYQRLLAGRPVRRILEIGLGPKGLFHKDQPAGCGLLMWRETFPEAEIFGLDNLEDTLINEGKIKSFLCDQSDAAWLARAAAWVGPNLDLIVDDASHKPADQILTASVFVPLLSPTGVYVIEDIIPGGECSKGLGIPHRTMELRTDALVDDRLIIIESRDFRHAEHP